MKKYLSITKVVYLMLALSIQIFAAKTLKISTTLPGDNPSVEALQYFADKVKSETNGELDVKVFNSSQLGGNRDGLEGLLLGTLEMVMVTAGPLAQFVPQAEIVSLPYMFQSTEHLHAALDGKPGEMIGEKLEDKGFVPLFWLDGGSRSIMNNKKPIYKPEDLNGLKIRVQPSNVTIAMGNAMGAIATPMEQGEVYGALEQGVLDGWENSPTTLYSLKLYEVTKYFSETNHLMAPDVLLMSKKVYSKLTPQEQIIVKNAAKDAQNFQRKLWVEKENDIIENLKNHGVVFNKVDSVEPFVERTKYLWEEFSKKNGNELIEEVQKSK